MIQWNSYGFDSVQTYNYTVMLTFPNKSSLNILNIVSNNGSSNVLMLFKQNHWVGHGEGNPDVVPPYIACSSSRELK